MSSMAWPGGMRGTPSSALIILYYPNRGLGVPSNFYRGPGDPLLQWGGSPHVLQGSPGTLFQVRMGSLQFLQGSPARPFCNGGFSFMFCKGPRGPPSAMEDFPSCFTRVPGDPCAMEGFPSYLKSSIVLLAFLLASPTGC